MKLIIDTNIIFSGLIRASFTRDILLSIDFTFYLPDYYHTELKKYIPLIREKMGVPLEEVKKTVDLVHEQITFVPEEEYSKKMPEAVKIMGQIDEKDVPFIALALSIKNDGIWTNDKHFLKQDKLKVYSTADIIEILNK
ncbi:MAG: PIN domain-containing protein [Promethearchaeia archaeon]